MPFSLKGLKEQMVYNLIGFPSSDSVMGKGLRVVQVGEGEVNSSHFVQN